MLQMENGKTLKEAEKEQKKPDTPDLKKFRQLKQETK